MILLAAILLLALVLLIAGFEMLMVLGIPTLAVKAGFFSAFPDAVLAQKLVGGINQSLLMAIPFFLFAANLMSRGQIARRLTNLVRSVVGHWRGGLGYTTIGSAMGFGAVSGSAPATVAALGHIMYPELTKSGFSSRFSLGLIVSSAETALLIPPSITLIIYGWLTGTSITDLFAAGLAIGVFLGLAFAALTAIEARRRNVARQERPTWAGFASALREGIWSLGMPVVIMGGIYSGLFTPTEAAVMSIVYALVVETVIHRALDLKGLIETAERAAVQTSVIFLLLALGALLSYFVTLAQVPQTLIGWIEAADIGLVTFLIIVNIVFIVAGMFVDPNSIQIILVPPLYPVAMSLGVDPVHFGMIVAINVTLGMITPPFGLDLFVASSSLRRPVTEVISGVWPFIAVNLIVLLVVSYVPEITMLLPDLLR